MLQVTEALAQVLRRADPLAATNEALPAALGLVLAEDVASDLDMPPYDKSVVDGYAVRMDADAETPLAVIEEIAAGHVPTRTVQRGQAARIMTGAMVPDGAEAVVMVEKTALDPDGRVRLAEPPAKPGQHVLRRGREMRSGEIILPAGRRIRPQEMGVLAAVGRASVRVYPRPKVAIITTGDEVVEPDQCPGPGQIRNSNASMLQGQVVRAGGVPTYLGIARDTRESLTCLIQQGLGFDVLLLSGGVSAGKLDLVPEVLESLGVRPVFHKIAMKPGKPLYFGVHSGASPSPPTSLPAGERGGVRLLPSSPGEGVSVSGVGARTLVFGLPGNPVSSLVGFELFVRPGLRKMGGASEPGPQVLPARLAVDWEYSTDRPTYYPCRLEPSRHGWQVTPVPWFGSADLRAIVESNAFMVVAAGTHRLERGTELEVLTPEL